MMRKAKNGISIGGRSASGIDSMPTSFAVKLEESIRLPTGGGRAMTNLFLCSASSGQANSTSPAGCASCQRPSMAAIFEGCFFTT